MGLIARAFEQNTLEDMIHPVARSTNPQSWTLIHCGAGDSIGLGSQRGQPFDCRATTARFSSIRSKRRAHLGNTAFAQYLAQFS